MTNTEISDNNPEKELIINKSNSDDKTKQISKKNTTQNKKITPKNDKSTKSFDEISNEIFRDLLSKKDSLVREIKDLETKKVAGYILDLRSNPGGLLESSIDISRHFINKGVIVSTVSKDGLKETKKGNGQALTKKPLVVLVNEGSASASEIVSGAIKDNKRGKLIGKKKIQLKEINL